MTQLQRIRAAAVRMMVGITGQSTSECQWYVSIGSDGAAELAEALAMPDDDLESRMIAQLVKLEKRMDGENLTPVRMTTLATLAIAKALYPDSAEDRYNFATRSEEARRLVR